MQVVFTSRAEKSVKSLPAQDMKLLIKHFMDLCATTDWWKNQNIKHITGAPFYRYKSGKYRIIFDQDGYIVNVYDVRKRNENTYKNL